MRQIFISYARCDQEFAARLADDLRASGADIWIDVRNAEQGRYWTRSIERALSDSHMMIVILSPGALATTHVNVEWQAYLEAYRPVIPVLAAPCDPPGPLRTRRPVDFTRQYMRAFHYLTTRLLEHSTRARRLDPVIWTLAETVQGFREEKAQVAAPSSPTVSNNGSGDSVDNGLRRMVQSLRDRLRRVIA